MPRGLEVVEDSQDRVSTGLFNDVDYYPSMAG
jgi:hypothetical protein